MGVVTVHIGPVLLHRVEGGGWAIDLETSRGCYEASGPDSLIIVHSGGGRDAVILPGLGCLDLGVDIVDLGAHVLGHPLGGGASIDEGVNN